MCRHNIIGFDEHNLIAVALHNVLVIFSNNIYNICDGKILCKTVDEKNCVRSEEELLRMICVLITMVERMQLQSTISSLGLIKSILDDLAYNMGNNKTGYHSPDSLQVDDEIVIQDLLNMTTDEQQSTDTDTDTYTNTFGLPYQINNVSDLIVAAESNSQWRDNLWHQISGGASRCIKIQDVSKSQKDKMTAVLDTLVFLFSGLIKSLEMFDVCTSRKFNCQMKICTDAIKEVYAIPARCFESTPYYPTDEDDMSMWITTVDNYVKKITKHHSRSILGPMIAKLSAPMAELTELSNFHLGVIVEVSDIPTDYKACEPIKRQSLLSKLKHRFRTTRRQPVS